MSLRLICGRAGTGKSEFCYEEIKNNINNGSKIYVITPEQYSFTAEKKLLEKLEQKSTIKAEVLSFARMAYRVLGEVGGITKKNLSKAGRAMLIYDVLENQKNNLTFLGKTSQNVELIQTQLTELKKHTVSLDILKKTTEELENRYLREKLKDIITIYEKQEEKLKGKYIEETDSLDILAEKLEESNLFKNDIFYIDEFSGFTKQEYRVIGELLKVAKQVNVTITTDNLDMQTNMEKDIFHPNKQTADKLLFIARENEIECERTVFLNTPYRFENKELLHLEKNIQAIPYKTYNGEVSNISIFLAKNPYSEIEEVAKQIIKLVKQNNYRYKDIIVMTKQVEIYSSLCKAIFASYNIPLFMDEKKELSQNEFAKYILAILEVYSSNWAYEAVIEYIKTGFTDIDENEIYEFENYTKKWGIKGSKWYKNEWNFGEDTEDKKQIAKKMKIIRSKVIEPLVKLKENLSQIKTVEQMNIKLYEFLEQNNIKEKIELKQNKLEEEGKLDLAKEQELAWNVVISVLEEMGELFESEKVSFEKYRELLKMGLSQTGLGRIPQSQDQVIVGDLDRTRTHEIKAVFIVGVNDGVFPTIQKQEGFLNDKDRDNLKEKGIELAKGTIENLYQDNLNIYKALTIAKEKLFFSYPSSDSEGAALRPSTYITKLKKIFVNLKEDSELVEKKFTIVNESNTFEELIEMIRQNGEKNLPDYWKAVEKYFEESTTWKQKLAKAKEALNNKNSTEKITKENINKLYGNTLVTSISKLEKYKSCPFSYYLEYGLKLKKPEEYKLQSIDTGTFMHEVIDSFFHTIREKELDVKSLEEEQIKSIIEEIIEEKLSFAKYYIFGSSDKFKILTLKLKRVIFTSMKYIINELKNSDFQVFANELEFKKGKEYSPITIPLEDGKKVEITGKIDRVDLAKTENGKYLRIIDYKSSVKNIDLNQVVAGIQIQLLTYLDAACEIEDVMPAGVLYYNLIDPILKVDKKIDKEQIEEELKKQFKMNGFVLADINIVKMMDKSLEAGYSKVVPVYLDKEGNINKSRSNTITKEQFEDLRKYTKDIIKQISKEILSGNIEINPYYQKKNKKTPCDYCEYKQICNFKENNNCSYRYIENLKKEEILESIRKEKEE